MVVFVSVRNESTALIQSFDMRGFHPPWTLRVLDGLEDGFFWLYGLSGATKLLLWAEQGGTRLFVSSIYAGSSARMIATSKQQIGDAYSTPCPDCCFLSSLVDPSGRNAFFVANESVWRFDLTQVCLCFAFCCIIFDPISLRCVCVLLLVESFSHPQEGVLCFSFFAVLKCQRFEGKRNCVVY
jgi:hypothetical protein